MAKYNVTYSCGHEETVCLFGKNSERQRKIAWMEENICPSCWKKKQEEERAAANAAAAEKNRKEGLPELQGTEKQVSWAESIRAAQVEEIDQAESYLLETERLFNEKPDSKRIKMRRESMEKKAAEIGFSTLDDFFQACHHAITILKNRTSASWWIDHRNEMWRDIIIKEAQKIYTETREDKDKKQQAMAEAMLVPAEKICDTPAEISFTENKVTVYFPVKKREFWDVIKPGLGFSWSGSKWELDISPRLGKAVDRAAEAGHKILAAGFPVVIWDEQAREMTANGMYEPRHPRWIVKISGERFGIIWPRGDDLYSEARRITGSTWAKPYVAVPASEYLEVIDFAEMYDFKMSDGAKEMIAAQKKIIESASVVVPKEVKDRHLVDKTNQQLPKATCEIDVDLRDD